MSLPRFTASEIEAKLRSLLADGTGVEDAVRSLHADEGIGTLFLWRAVAATQGLERRDAMRLTVRAIDIPNDIEPISRVK